jgi:hypothetical protein
LSADISHIVTAVNTHIVTLFRLFSIAVSQLLPSLLSFTTLPLPSPFFSSPPPSHSLYVRQVPYPASLTFRATLLPSHLLLTSVFFCLLFYSPFLPSLLTPHSEECTRLLQLLEGEKSTAADLELQVENLKENLRKSQEEAVQYNERGNEKARDEEMKGKECEKLKQELNERDIFIRNLQREYQSKTDDLISQTTALTEKDSELAVRSQQLQDLQREKASVNIEEIIQNKLLEVETKFSIEKKEIKREFDAKIIELLEVEKSKFENQVSIIRSEHTASIEEEKRRLQEGVQMSRSVSEKEIASREQSNAALKVQFESKMQASDAQMSALKQQLNRLECRAVVQCLLVCSITN